MADSKPKVFISYAREDAVAAKRLFSDLCQAGADPWLDTESLSAGARFESVIRSTIRESRFFVALLSTNSVRKKGLVNAEIVEALKVLDEFPESEVYVIPVRLNECQPSHSKLSQLHWADMFASWESGLSQILETIGLSATGQVAQGRRAEEALRATIVAPKKGAESPHTVQMAGVIHGLQPGTELWVVKEPSAGNYHPDRGPANVDGNTWTAVAFIGNATLGADSGKKFSVHLVAASHETGRRFNDYIDRAHQTNAWAGLNTLFDGRIVATTWVRRNDSHSA